MHKAFLSLFHCLLAATLAAPAIAHGGMGPGCPRHSHWVPSHRDRHGHWVRGHCSYR